MEDKNKEIQPKGDDATLAAPEPAAADVKASVPTESVKVSKPETVEVRPDVVDSEPCITPTEQDKLSGKAAPKKKGRPPKNALAKAKAKAKATAKATAKGKAASKTNTKAAASAKSKAASKAKAKAKPRARKAKIDKSESEPEDTTAADEEEVKPPTPKKGKKSAANTASSSHEGEVKAKVTKPEAKAKVSGKGEKKQQTLDENPAVVRTKRARPGTTSNTDKPETSHDDIDSTAETSHTNNEAAKRKQEAKERNARKSAAYRRAIKKAKDEGLNEEDCKAAGKKVL